LPATSFPLYCQFVTIEQLPDFFSAHAGKVLGIVHYAAPTVPSLSADSVPIARVYKTVLGGQSDRIEVWHVPNTVVYGNSTDTSYAHDGNFLFGVLQCPAGADAMRAGARQIYLSLFRLLKDSGYAHLVRVWNAIPDIHATDDGLERYRAFNLGRHEAFVAAGISTRQGAPAATALGTPSGPLLVYFLAARQAPQALENPRQVSAYHYPAQYGPQAPSFSRAALLTLQDSAMLFVSGTASIVGHESLHIGNVQEQTNESLRNVEAVLQCAALSCCKRLQDLNFKVYVRRQQDYPIVRAQMEQHRLHHANTLYLEADICREELLMELEAIGPASQIMQS
jgi:enamine deaminase RidA (YjgF/YER057c/UK114 family)